MFGLLCKRLQIPTPNWRVTVSNSTTHLCFLQYIDNASLLFPFRRSFSSPPSSNERSIAVEKKQSFTVSYLINSCGFSPKTAFLVSKRVQFETLERPDSVLDFLRKHGLTGTNISKIVRRNPRVLLADPEKTLLPKLEFFHSIGVSSSDLAVILSSSPIILNRSLKNQIIPFFSFVKNVVSDDKKLIKILRHSHRICLPDVQKNMAPNLAALRGIGVPESKVSSYLISHLKVLVHEHANFTKTVKQLIKMGFDPKKSGFLGAIGALCCVKKSNWEHKLKVYRRWGWSEDEIQLAFMKCPMVMVISKENIMNGMDFLVSKMGWQSAEVARVPQVLCYSLKKRIIPRCSVINILLLKGLIKKNVSLSTVVVSTEKYFLDKFVTIYKEDVPQLLNLYKEIMNSGELEPKI